MNNAAMIGTACHREAVLRLGVLSAAMAFPNRLNEGANAFLSANRQRLAKKPLRGSGQVMRLCPEGAASISEPVHLIQLRGPFSRPRPEGRSAAKTAPIEHFQTNILINAYKSRYVGRWVVPIDVPALPCARPLAGNPATSSHLLPVRNVVVLIHTRYFAVHAFQPFGGPPPRRSRNLFRRCRPAASRALTRSAT
jgi:hypothetical protein